MLWSESLRRALRSRHPAALTAWDREFTASVYREAALLKHEPDAILADRIADLRAVQGASDKLSDGVVRKSFGLTVEAVRRTLGWQVYEVQLIASQRLTQRLIAEMQTGEGKTLSCAPATVTLALFGRGVHVATPNIYLAERDCQQLKPVYELLGLKVGLLPERVPPEQKRDAYRCDITYGTGYEFGFDFLKDQLAAEQREHQILGAEIINRLSGRNVPMPTRMQRRLAFTIVDEADHVLLDDAVSPLVISGGTKQEAPDAEIHQAARQIIELLRMEEHFNFNGPGGSTRLTPAGIQLVHDIAVAPSFHLLRRPWVEYVQQAIQAEYRLQRNVHYVVNNDTIDIIDASSGRIFSERSWRDGLHQAVEAKEMLKISSEQDSLAQITRQRFYRMYEQCSGMTGTVSGCARELRHVYNLGVSTVPRRFPSRRHLLPMRFFCNRQRKWEAIAESVDRFSKTGQPVLVGANSIVDSIQLSELFTSRGINHQLLNGRQDSEEAEVVGRAGQMGCVTIATNMAGRGTDIRLGPGVTELGGLHVIVSEVHPTHRVDLQLIGRSARQNDPGSAQKFACSEDYIFQVYGDWIGRAAERYADRSGEITVDLSAQVRRIQQIAERAQYAARCQLLRNDLARESLRAATT